MSLAYYNEIDPHAAMRLRNLIAAGLIAPGDVDTRSIEDVTPNDLRGYSQCHFFAGIGIWSLALRRAGWPDSRQVWTGSCPCQPFSAAGKGMGFDDERHLWPAFYHLIAQCSPAVVFGEQVASRDADPWIDLVCADVEALDYAFGAVPFPAAGVGAPHIRDRLYWVADADSRKLNGVSVVRGAERDRQGPGWPKAGRQPRTRRHHGRVEHSRPHDDTSQEHTASAGQSQADRPADQPGGSGVPPDRPGDSYGEPARRDTRSAHAAEAQYGAEGGDDHRLGNAGAGVATRPGPVNGLWRDVDWLFCRDDKWRPVESGTFPLVDAWPHGSRVGCLRAAGNAITLGQAQAFIECSGLTKP